MQDGDAVREGQPYERKRVCTNAYVHMEILAAKKPQWLTTPQVGGSTARGVDK